jgi:uncharacterized membrane protein
MISGWLLVVTVAALLGSALVAGALYAFSSFVMRALARLPDPQGIAAMQSINLEAPTFWFMLGFMGTAVLCAVLLVASIVEWGEPYAGHLLAGSLLYLVGTIGLTGGYHVPRNNALATLDPDRAEAAPAWRRYVTQWTAMNHVRVLAGLAAAAVLALGLRAGA